MTSLGEPRLDAERNLLRGRWIHQLPAARAVDKNEFLASLVAGKTVVHAGCWGPAEWPQLELPSWVHGALSRTAARLIGIDINEDGVRQAIAAGYEAYVVDCQDPAAVRDLGIKTEVVVAGELIEHLEQPGRFLDAMHHLSDTLVVTTPNAFSLVNVVGVLLNREIINPDHIALYSWYTLTNILQRHGWRVRDAYVTHYLQGSSIVDPPPPPFRRWLVASFLRSQRLISRFRPFTAHGLLFVCDAC